MMVAPGIAARVAARLATTPGGKPGGRPGMADPAAAAGTAGVCWAAGLVPVELEAAYYAQRQRPAAG